MKPQNNYESAFADIVLSLENQSQMVENGTLSHVKHENGMFYYQLAADTEALLQSFPNALHYLDRFWLLLPDSLKNQRLLWDRFYQSYSPNYEELINHAHNVLCLRYFERVITCQNDSLSEYKLLDFGCGPGLSAEVFPLEQLTGYDNNAEMLRKAKLKGIAVVNRQEFKKIPPNTFHGCIACYVFHMAIEDDDIIHLAGLINNGGFIVANFYKGLGESRMTNFFRMLGFDVEQINGSDGRFGSVFVYRKR